MIALRAKDMPAPGQNQPKGGFSSLATSGGGISTTSGKSALEWEEIRARQIPGPEHAAAASSVLRQTHNALHAAEVQARADRSVKVRRKLKAAVRVVAVTSKISSVAMHLMKLGMKSGLAKPEPPPPTAAELAGKAAEQKAAAAAAAAALVQRAPRVAVAAVAAPAAAKKKLVPKRKAKVSKKGPAKAGGRPMSAKPTRKK